jgi:hypothetical protein
MIPRHFLISTALLCGVAIAMSVYVWRLRRLEALKPPPAAVAQHVTPPSVGPTEKVVLYVAYDDPGELHAQSISIPLSSGRQQRAQELLRALVNVYLQKGSPHRLAASAEIRDVYMLQPGIAVIDVNSAFANGQTSGVLGEELTVVTLIQTLSANIPGLLQVKILVDSKERDTLAGHADLSGFYDVSQVSDLAKQLSAQ